MPELSIIIATYNSPHLLKYAIQSILDNDYSDWELLVIGDCCTDDTQELVHSFNDNRIVFKNLPENSGQQAKPTNVAFQMASGEYITFLNQDDFFLPHHLRSGMEEIKKTKSEFLVTPGLKIIPPKDENFDRNSFKAELVSVHANQTYIPHIFTVASTWLIQKSVVDKIGPWKLEKSTYVSPSQEFIFRAWSKGIKFCMSKKISVIVIFSGDRKNSYQKKQSPEHEFLYENLKDPEFQRMLLESAAINSENRRNEDIFSRAKGLLSRTMAFPIDWTLSKLKIHPLAIRHFLRYGKKGGYVDAIKKRSGL